MQSLKHYVVGGLVAAVLMAAGSLLTHSLNAAPPAKSTAPARGYYVTSSFFNGSQALTACAAGYHMASLYEIFEPSNLRYETSLGFTQADSGSGPPTGYNGWIRTGNQSAGAGTGGLGSANCEAWTSSAETARGDNVFLTTSDLSNLVEEHRKIGVWGEILRTCDVEVPVWCVQD